MQYYQLWTDDEDPATTKEPQINGTPSKTFNFEDEEKQPLTDHHACSGASGKTKSPGTHQMIYLTH